MEKRAYFGVFDFDGYKTAIADNELPIHLMCGYYAGWINPDGRIHAVNYHEAFNSDNPGNTETRDAYGNNFANGYIRWYGYPKGEFGLRARTALTQAQATTLIKLLFWCEPGSTYIDAETGSKVFYAEDPKTDIVSTLRKLQKAA